jgi:DnaJ-class molecular chaperone
MRDPYDVLGLDAAADAATIRRAFRERAKRLHPDLNPGDLASAQAFQELTQAYALLIDPVARARWDAGDHGGTAGGEGDFPFRRGGWDQYEGGATAGGDIFADFFTDESLDKLRSRQPRRGEDLTYRVSVPLQTVAAGGRQRIRLASGRELEVSIPPGVEQGQVLRLVGQGLPGRHGGAAGDALVEVEVEPHGRFRRSGADLHLDFPVSLGEAVNGGTVTVPTVTGAVGMRVPPGSNSGTVLRLKGRGLPDRQGGQGDQYVHLTVVLPDPPDAELARFLERWSPRHPYDPRVGKPDED